MYKETIYKPRQWDERSLALATREELVADLLVRKNLLERRKASAWPWGRRASRKDVQWIEVLKKELEQRNEWVVE